MTSNPAPWMTEDNINLLIRMWEKGDRADDIACAISNLGYRVTRNSIIGKAHRLKLVHGTVTNPELKRIKRPQAAPKSIQREIQRAIRKLPTSERKQAYEKLVQLKTKPPKSGAIIMNKEPDLSKEILLTETKEHHCRAIVRYHESGEAICCGDNAITVIQRGRTVKSPWCSFHYKKYTQEPQRK